MRGAVDIETGECRLAEEFLALWYILAVNAPQGVEGRVVAGRYLVEALLGRGGMASVFRARHTVTGRRVALKVLHPRPHWEPDEVERFVREARITARLQHPAIVPVYESGRWPTGEPFYAMRLVRGRSLADVVRNTHGLAERLALVPNLVAVADALAYAHAQRVIHRDLKPGNVLLGAFGETVVIDWGLAKDLAARTD